MLINTCARGLLCLNSASTLFLEKEGARKHPGLIALWEVSGTFQLLQYQYWLRMSHLEVLVPGAGCKLNKLDS
jgi:hypothetical protein